MSDVNGRHKTMYGMACEALQNRWALLSIMSIGLIGAVADVNYVLLSLLILWCMSYYMIFPAIKSFTKQLETIKATPRTGVDLENAPIYISHLDRSLDIYLAYSAVFNLFPLVWSVYIFIIYADECNISEILQAPLYGLAINLFTFALIYSAPARILAHYESRACPHCKRYETVERGGTTEVGRVPFLETVTRDVRDKSNNVVLTYKEQVQKTNVYTRTEYKCKVCGYVKYKDSRYTFEG